jgi:uncharacterized repeat protein (TIGR03847 family)
MPRRTYFFDPPDRFVAGTVGEPGKRTFFLQARKAGQLVSVVLEKVQVQVLAERLDQLLDELEARGITSPNDETAGVDSEPLDEPLIEAFRATTLTLGWDVDAERVLVEARAEPVEVEIEAEIDDDEEEGTSAGLESAAEPGEGEVTESALDASLAASIIAAFESVDDDDGPDVLRVRVTAQAARSFVERAAKVVASGRPPCPLCGQPLDPQGHICARRNGHYVN